MEKVVVVKLEVDYGQSISEAEKLEQSLQEVNDAYKEIASTATTSTDKAEQALKDLNAQVEKNEMTFGELRQTLEKYKDVAIQAGRESPIGKEAILQAAELQNKLDDLDAEVRNLANDGINLQASMQLGQGILAGYTAFQGVTAMLGVENEELMKTMVKLQGATSVLMSVEQIRASLEKESFLMQKARIIQTNVMTGAQALYATAVGASTGAMKLFRLALLATGIGALIVGIGLLIANFDTIKKAVISFGETLLEVFKALINPIGFLINLFSDGEDKMTKSAQRGAEARQKAIDAELKANEKRRSDIDKTIAKNKEETDRIADEYDYRIRLAKANGENTNALEIEKLKAMESAFEVERALALEKLKLIKADFEARMQGGQMVLSEMLEARKMFAEQLAIVKGSNEKLLDAKRDLIVKEAEIRTANRNKTKEDNEKDIEILDRHLNDVRVKIDSMVIAPDFKLIPDNDYMEAQVTRLQEFYDRWVNMSNEAKLNLAQGAIDYTSEIMASIATITDAVNQGAQMEVASIEATRDRKLKNDQLSAMDRYKIEVESAKATDKINKQIFERNKKMQIAQGLVDGASAVIKALASAPPPFNFILAGAVATASLAQLNAIRKQQYQSTASSIEPPSFNTSINDSDTSNGTNANGQNNGSQTYISSTVSVIEINNTQERLEDINNVAIIGG